VLKIVEPEDAKMPTRKWKLYPFKGDNSLGPISIYGKTAFLFGREKLVADILLEHPSCSKQHAVLQHRGVKVDGEDGIKHIVVKPYIIDLKSTNGTYLNGNRIEDSRYYELKEKDVLKFGFSSREYVLLREELVDKN